MRQIRFEISIASRLIACILLGGVIATGGLGWLQLRHSESLLRVSVTQEVLRSVRLLQNALRHHEGRMSDAQLHAALYRHMTQPQVHSAHVLLADKREASTGPKLQVDDQNVRVWQVTEQTVAGLREVELDQVTRLVATFGYGSGQAVVTAMIDGPSLRSANQQKVVRSLAPNWLFMAIMMLLGLTLLRRWLVGPLMVLMDLIGAHAGPEGFYRLARRCTGDLSKLAEAVGGMLTRLENTTERLHKKEHALDSLYQQVPVAMINIDPAGKIVAANRRAGELLGLPTERILIGSPILPFVAAEDRGLLHQAIDRLNVDRSARCEMRLEGEQRTIQTAVKLAGQRDEDGRLVTVCLTFTDLRESNKLRQELADKSRLLNLIIDHMSDAILLVDESGRIAAVNQQLGALLRRRPDSLIGQPYNAELFWGELGVVDHDTFHTRMRQIQADEDRAAQERFEARVGTFLFQSVPVHDASGQAVGRLWVVAEVTSQEQNQRLLDQQTTQLQSLKRLGSQLVQIGHTDELIERMSSQLFDMFGVEAAGLALRSDRPGARSQQVLNRGTGAYLLEPNQQLLGAVEQHLMPQLLSNREVTYWPDLPRTAPWARAFEQAGLTTLAGAPLGGGADPHGILWIARRGGERIEHHHIYLLEAVVPMIAGRLDLLEMRRRMRQLHLTDPATDLPNQQHFEQQLIEVAQDPPPQWSTLAIALDHFEVLYDTIDVASADQLLRATAVALKRSMRKSCFIARLQGPTFAVICPHMDHHAAVAMANRLRTVIAEQQITLPDGHTWQLTASIGVAGNTLDGPDAAELFKLASDRLEMARRSGRDRVVDGDTHPRRRVG